MGETDDAQGSFDLPSGRIDAVHQKDGQGGISGFEPFEQIEQQGRVVAVAGAHVLQFDDQCVEIQQAGFVDGRGHFDGFHTRDHRPVKRVFRRENTHQVAAACQALEEIFACIGVPGHLVAKQTQAPLSEHLVFLCK